MADDVRVAQPLEYYRRFLDNEVRPDGRGIGETRPTVVSMGSITTSDGSALVKMGNTTVICGIKGELTCPDSEAPNEGKLVPNVDLPPMCSPLLRSGPPSYRAQALSQLMADILTQSKCLDLKQLCIAEEKWSWVLYCDLMCLDLDGNIIDACVLALVAALHNVKLPAVQLQAESGLPEVDKSTCSGLSLHICPVASTFTLFDGKILLIDPTQEEESLSSGAVTIVTTGDQLCYVYKPGGSAIREEELMSCIQKAQKRGSENLQLINKVKTELKE